MKKKIIFTSLIFIGISVLAYTGYKISDKQSVQNEEPKKVEKTTNKFAIQELILVLKKYSEAKSIDAEFNTKLIAEDGVTELNSFEGKYVKDEKNLYIQSFGSQNLLNEKYLIAIDDDEEIMYVEKPEFEKKGNFLQFNFLSDLDSMINLPDSLIFYEKLDDNKAKISIEIASGNYYKTELIYTISSKELLEVHLYPYDELFDETPEEGEISDKIVLEENNAAIETEKDKPLYLSFIYKKLEINKELDKKWFDESRYFKTENQKLVTSKAYKNYEIEFE